MKAARRTGMLAFVSRSEPNKLMIDKVWLPKPKQKEFLKSLEYRTLESGENEVEKRRWNEEEWRRTSREDSQAISARTRLHDHPSSAAAKPYLIGEL